MGLATATFVGSLRARRWRRFDAQLFLYVLLLVAFGVVMGYSAGFGTPLAGEHLSQTVKTVIWAAIGLTLFFAVAGVDYHWLRTLAVPIYLAVVGLLVLTMLAGTSLFGAQMSLTLLGLDFQVSEVSKVLTVTVLAAFLAGRGPDAIGRPSTIAIAAAVVAVPAFLVFRQPDLGTALVFGAILLGMLFLAGASVGWLGILVGAAAAAAPIAVSLLHDYQRQRLFCFLDPHVDPQGACFQLVQALNAVGSGGLLGRGLTVGAEGQRGYVPVQTTDFVFTIVAEDLGLVGSVVLLALFGLLLWRILLIGWQAHDSFGRLIAVGLASIIGFQLVVNVGMVIGIMPVTGIPMPFITYGGSSLISLLFGLGILESVRMRSQGASL
ncbi:MAG: rod shape-determining protein RodA [Chloroflexi bacterium]|nr:rod shape-determining protein RodA [Chloroflexota bacterium]